MALIDQYGNPVRLQQLRQLQAEPGVTGIRQIWSTSVAAGLTPFRLASILRACDEGSLDDFLILAEEMEERDPHYFSVIGLRKRMIAGIVPRVDAVSNGAQDRRIAEAIEADIVNHDGFGDLVEDILDALGKGFSVVEIDWQTSAARWRPRQFLFRDPRFFTFDRETGRELRLRDEADPVNGMPLEPWHFITHTARLKSGLPWRGGLARVAAFSWMCKAYTLKDWMAFIETYGLPLRLGRYGPQATKADVEALYRAVANIGTDAAAVLPENMKIDFEQGANGTGDKIFENLARYVDEQLSKAVLGQTMTSDTGGSLAQAKVHDEVRHDIAASDARAISATLNRDLIRPYVDLNFGPQQSYPRLVIEVDEPEDRAAWVDGVSKLMQQGLKVRAADVYTRFRLGVPAKGDEVIGGLAARTHETAMNSTEPALGWPPSDIDEIEGELLDGWRPVMQDLLAPIEALVASVSSFEELRGKLPLVIGEMDDRALVETLVKGMFMARTVGNQRDE